MNIANRLMAVTFAMISLPANAATYLYTAGGSGTIFNSSFGTVTANFSVSFALSDGDLIAQCMPYSYCSGTNTNLVIKDGDKRYQPAFYELILNFTETDYNNWKMPDDNKFIDGSFNYYQEYMGAYSYFQGSITSLTRQETSWDSRGQLTVMAVPEPASWTMMIGGLGLVGLTLRRRTMAVRFI